MANRHEQTPEHKKAHDLAEQALDKAAGGDPRKARELIEEAKRIDPKIGDEMAREAAEDQKKADKYVDKNDK
ncbi:hypothetical protein [Azospirillum sp. TSO35-2]|uniref:hypothetical protein n=1 Tax=Azospirillum sp. TSO35-2 TaxID=716796 RepID=UPI0011B7D885|nr:hypothetical protein [Azospirillum sp. TSO35-2]